MRAVVFDLGGVLIDWDPRYVYRQLLDDEAAVERFLAEICTPEWHAAHDRDRPFAEGIAELTARHPQEAALIGAYRERWDEMLAGPIEDSVAVLAELRDRNVPLYALTNYSAEVFPPDEHRYGFISWFRGVVVSGREGLVKPDAEIFRLLIDRFDLDPGQTVFVDDAPANVAAAKEAGLDAIHFTDPATLRRDLTTRALLPSRRA